MKKPKVLSRKRIYRSSWLSLFLDKVEFPGGRIIAKHHRLNFHREGVISLVEDSAARILLVRAFRYLTDSVEWELPAGTRDKRESVLACARREVLEESGYETTHPRLLYRYYPALGISDLVYYVVRSRAGKNTGVFDRNEVRGFACFSKSKIRALIRKKGIRDGFSLTGLLLHLGGYF